MTKIEALKKTIYNLENNVYVYRWTDSDSCNCGILAQSITGKVPFSSGYCDVPDNGLRLSPWGRRSVCLKTGLPLPLVWQAIKDCGFTHKELANLELFKDKKICSLAAVEQWEFSIKSSLIKYLKAWVEILEEEKLNSEPLAQECDASKVQQGTNVGSIKTIIKYVSVPETIKESVPETSLS